MDNRSPRSLKVRGDSRKIIKKPPMSPQPPHIHQQEPSQSRAPRIIYKRHPKTIRTIPDDFKALVQSLTGMPSTSTASSSSSTSSSAAVDASCGLISTENASNSNELGTFVGGVGTMDQYYNHHHQQQHQHHPAPTSLREDLNIEQCQIVYTMAPKDNTQTFNEDRREEHSNEFCQTPLAMQENIQNTIVNSIHELAEAVMMAMSSNNNNNNSNNPEKLRVMVLPRCGTSKIPVEVNAGDNVGELRKELAKIQQRFQFSLPQEGYFFVHKQNVMDDDRSFRWHRVDHGDTIEIYNGSVSGGDKIEISVLY